MKFAKPRAQTGFAVAGDRSTVPAGHTDITAPSHGSAMRITPVLHGTKRVHNRFYGRFSCSCSIRRRCSRWRRSSAAYPRWSGRSGAENSSRASSSQPARYSGASPRVPARLQWFATCAADQCRTASLGYRMRSRHRHCPWDVRSLSDDLACPSRGADALDRPLFIPLADDRRLMSGITFVIGTVRGRAMRLLKTVRSRRSTRFIRWSGLGVFGRIFPRSVPRAAKPTN